MKANTVIVWITTVILVLFELYSLTVDSHYKYDFIFMMLLLWGVYKIRDRIRLHPFHFGLFAVFLVLHNLGVFGAYELYIVGLEYDLYVHGFFGFVSALMLYRTYKMVGPYSDWFMYVAIIAVVLGFSAFHELGEYAGALIIGEGEGVLGVGPGDLDDWDTQKDMRNNTVGAIVALVVYGIWNNVGKPVKRKRKRRKR